MKVSQFDHLARLTARGVSRRELLRAGLAAIVGSLVVGKAASAKLTCNAPFILCDGECFYSLTSNHHCGVCDNVCSGNVCNDGTCSSCESIELTTCTDEVGDALYCADLSTSYIDCGTCGNLCSTGPCVDGECVSTQDCESGFTECNGVCVDLQTDPYHCGACLGDCTGIPPGGQSSIGECVAGVCQVVCVEGYDVCDGNCIVGTCESDDEDGDTGGSTTLPNTGIGGSEERNKSALMTAAALAGAGVALAAAARHQLDQLEMQQSS